MAERRVTPGSGNARERQRVKRDRGGRSGGGGRAEGNGSRLGNRHGEEPDDRRERLRRIREGR